MANSRKIFGKIYDQHIDKIYRFIFIKVNSQEIAEDLCSETFLRGWRVFKEGKDKGGKNIENPQAFLYRVARNLVTDYYREKGRINIISAEYAQIIDPRANSEEEALLGSDLNIVRLALANLKENYQEIILWHYLDDLSILEIAKMMDKPEGTIRVILHRALKSLKNEFKQV